MADNFNLKGYLKKNTLLNENIGGYVDIKPVKEEMGTSMGEDDTAWPGNRKFSSFLEAVASAEDAFGVELNIRSTDKGFTYEDVDGNPITVIEINSNKAVVLTDDNETFAAIVTMQEFVDILSSDQA